MLSKANLVKRRNWAIKHIDQPINFWKSMIWSDESRFCLVSDKPEKCIRRSNETFKPECLRKTVKFDEGVMVWGCFSYSGVGALVWIDRLKVNSAAYCHILDQGLLQSIARLFPDGNYLFQQDNAPCHTSKVTKKWFDEKSIPLFTNWPPQSPDMNPIENLWSYIDRKIHEKPCKSRLELWGRIQTVWDAIPIDLIQRLILSMPNRLADLKKNRGGSTKY